MTRGGQSGEYSRSAPRLCCSTCGSWTKHIIWEPVKNQNLRPTPGSWIRITIMIRCPDDKRSSTLRVQPLLTLGEEESVGRCYGVENEVLRDGKVPKCLPKRLSCLIS